MIVKPLLFVTLFCLLSTAPAGATDDNEFALFFKSFSASLIKNGTLAISDTVAVECYANGDKGGLLDKALFTKMRAHIFPAKIVARFSNYDSTKVERKDKDYYTYAIGFSEWSKDAGMKHEYGFHYHFKKKNGQWQLTMISSTG